MNKWIMELKSVNRTFPKIYDEFMKHLELGDFRGIRSDLSLVYKKL